MSSDASHITISLPIAGQTLLKGDKIKAYQYVINKGTTVKDLKKVLSSYGRSCTGNRPELIARLEEFAKDKDAWSSLFQGEKKRKRGNISGTRTQRQSAKRIASLFELDNGPIEYQYCHDHDNHTSSALSNEATANLYSMVDEILGKDKAGPSESASLVQDMRRDPQPVVTASESTNVLHGSSDNPDAISVNTEEQRNVQEPQNITYRDIVGRNVVRRLTGVEDQIRRLNSGIENQMRGIFGLVSNIASGQVTATVPAVQPNTEAITSPASHWHIPRVNDNPAASSSTAPPTQPPQSSTPWPSPSHASPSVSAPKARTLTLVMDGRKATYDAQHVPDPPIQHFSKNIDVLFEHWTASSILSIDGDGIPLKYWPDVYQGLGRMGLKPKAWEAIKVEWGNWKFIVEAKDSFESVEAFWEAFKAEDGSRLGFQAILDTLKDQRETASIADAAAAKNYFGGNLDHPDADGAFRYTKGGKSYLLTKPAAISKRWRDLLKTNDTVRQQYLRSQGIE